MYASVDRESGDDEAACTSPAKIDVSQFSEKPRRRAKFMNYKKNPPTNAEAFRGSIRSTRALRRIADEVKANDSAEVKILVKKRQ